MIAGIRPPRSKKGFALTIDASIAVLIALLLITGSLFYLSQNSYSGFEDSLYYNAIDSLAVLEKSGAITDLALNSDDSSTTSYFDNLPYSTCARLEMFRENGDGSRTKVVAIARDGCTIPDRYAIGRRVIVSRGNIYLAELEVWRR